MSRGYCTFNADLVACVFRNPCGAPPLHPCDIEIGQGHLVHQPEAPAAVLSASKAASRRCWRRRLGSWLASAATAPINSSSSVSVTAR